MEINEKRILSSIPTHIIENNENFPKDFGSGCFVNYRNKCTLFLTVYHTVNNPNFITSILSDYDEKSGTILKPLPKKPRRFVKSDISNFKKKIIDFTYYKIAEPYKCWFFCIDESGALLYKRERIVLPTDLSCIPDKKEEYGFSGYTYGCHEFTPFVDARFQDICRQEPAIYSGLKYIGSEGDYHCFTIPNNDYEYKDFKGTSGAPILDSKGNLVALVAEGYPFNDGKEWIIKGINLEKYKLFIDIELGLI